MNWGIFEKFVAWLHRYDAKIEIDKCKYHGEPAIYFNRAFLDDVIRIVAMEHGLDIEERGVNIYVVAP